MVHVGFAGQVHIDPYSLRETKTTSTSAFAPRLRATLSTCDILADETERNKLSALLWATC